MKTSCITHPANEPLIIIRQWQYEFCEGDKIAAALMSFFEYWHNIKLEISNRNKRMVKIANEQGEEIEIDITLYQWHTYEDLMKGIIHIATSRATIKKGLDFLIEQGVITVHENPNPRLKFDRTNHYLFHPEICESYLDNRQFKNELSLTKNELAEFKSELPEANNEPAIPETTTETTTEITTDSLERHFSIFQTLANCLNVPMSYMKTKKGRLYENALVNLEDDGIELSPEKIKSYFEWWYENDWRGKKGSKPLPEQMIETWNDARQSPSGNDKVRVDPDGGFYI